MKWSNRVIHSSHERSLVIGWVTPPTYPNQSSSSQLRLSLISFLILQYLIGIALMKNLRTLVEDRFYIKQCCEDLWLLVRLGTWWSRLEKKNSRKNYFIFWHMQQDYSKIEQFAKMHHHQKIKFVFFLFFLDRSENDWRSCFSFDTEKN